MDTEAALFARLEKEQPAITCGMQHPPGLDPEKGLVPGPRPAEPCTRPATYIATVHDCTRGHQHPDNGTRVPICAGYLDAARHTPYPHQCAGCGLHLSSILNALWDLEHVHA